MTRLSLAELQSEFQRYLLVGDNEARLEEQVKRTGPAPVRTRLEVYRNAYYIRLEEALAHDFPVLLAVAGEEAFGRLASAYIRDHPSTSPSLRWLGQRLPEWLRRVAGEPALAELAALEWAVLQAFDGRDATRATVKDLLAVPAAAWPELRVAFHPSVSMLEVHASVREVWLSVRRGEASPALKAAAEWLVIWRSVHAPRVEAVSWAWHCLLTALAEGTPLDIACEKLARSVAPAEVPALVAEGLHHALARGWISGLQAPAERG